VNLKTKKILVTGGDGFLGKHVLAALKNRGIPDNQIISPKREECDLRKEKDCGWIARGADIILHLAGVTGDAEFHKKEPSRIYFDNLIMGTRLIEAARQAGAQKFVMIGSAAEYSEEAPLPFREEDLWIGYPEEKHAPYAIAKKLLSIQARAYYAQYKFLAIHLVMTNIYGPGESLASNVFIPALIKKVLEAKKNSSPVIEMYGNGEATRDFIYVKDAAEAILLAAEKCESPDSINIASGQEISVREMTDLAKKIVNFEGEIKFTSNTGGLSRRVLDITRARSLLGFEAQTDFETGLRETIKDFSVRHAPR
jgi:GDP-L-fucose synthase